MKLLAVVALIKFVVKVTDVCPPPDQEIYYSLFTNPPYYILEGGGNGLDGMDTVAEDIGAACQEKYDDSGGCSVSGVSMPSGAGSLLGMFLSLVF